MPRSALSSTSLRISMGQAFLHRQLLLVLLPILALAVFGAMGLRRDRSAVETEARDRASAATGQFADRFETEWPIALQKWLARAAVEGDGLGERSVELRFDPVLRLIQPIESPDAPTPPAWRRILSDSTRAALEDLREAEASGNIERIREQAAILQAPGASPPVIQTLAELSLLRTGAITHEPSAAMLALAQRALEEQWVNEAGIPVAMSAALWLIGKDPAALRSPEGMSIAGGLVREQPSILTPHLLAALRNIPGESADQERIEALTREWWVLEKRRAVARRLRELLSSGALPAKPFWVDANRRRWLAVCRIGESGLTVRLYLRETVEQSVAGARQAIGSVGLPAGIRIGISLSGESLASEISPEGPAFAEVIRQFGNGSSGVEGDLMPEARFRAELHEPQALFGAQVRQQRIFAGLLAGVVGVAGVGLWQTRLAFLRQLALNEEKTNFVSAVSHELRSPLASLRLLAEALADGRAESPAKRREYATFLVQETRRLGTLVENVLDFSRIDQGRKVYAREAIDLPRLIRETARILMPVAEERAVTLAVEVTHPAETFEIEADAPALQQMLLNLVDNALKHAPPRSVVDVRLDQGPDRQRPIRLTVRDAGPGIPAEDHLRIFDRFFRRGSELHRDTHGVGLGLAIVRHVVEGHDGKVWVESEPGRGATFFVDLPMDSRAANS